MVNSPPTIEHAETPIFYCWKYWLSNGKIKEGCTAAPGSFFDLNLYGWMYMALPVVAVFLLGLLLRCLCQHGEESLTQIIQADDDDESVPNPDYYYPAQPATVKQASAVKPIQQQQQLYKVISVGSSPRAAFDAQRSAASRKSFSMNTLTRDQSRSRMDDDGGECRFIGTEEDEHYYHNAPKTQLLSGGDASKVSFETSA